MLFRVLLAATVPLAIHAQDALRPAAPEPPKPAPAASRPAASANLSSAAARRNENVAVNRIDNDAQKEANVRLGNNITIVSQPPVESNYYTTEHGRPPGDSVILRPSPPVSSWHGELTYAHQNSVFNARTFFQVGPVKPSHQNHYGGRFTGQAGGLGSLTGTFNQRDIRGMVNGNVLVPKANERTPASSDPRVRTIVARYLAAYPADLPNRPDFDERALNTNAPQRIEETDASLRLDRAAGPHGRVAAFHSLTRQRVDAFQLVAGQNPDMDIHSHRSRLNYRHAVSDRTEMSIGAGFQRVASYLRPEPNAVGPRVRMGFQIEELGPDSQFPINRALNSYRWAALFRTRLGGGRHELTYGGDGTRYQLNGIETNNQRGLLWFTSNFGRTAIENLRLGTPTTYEVTLGEMARGFRNWGGSFYAADQWRVSSRLQLYFGLRYGFETAPHEVDGLNEIPYGCDCNNFTPRFSIAYNAAGGWTARAAYTVSFGQIFPVTYQQVRYNPPHARYIQEQNPDLLRLLGSIDLTSPNVRSSPTFLAPDLVSPYVHQYSLALERRLPGNLLLRTGYVGSRTIKLLNVFIGNRGVPVPGIPLTTATVDQRRADPRYYDVKDIVNGGIAYLDAGQATIEMPARRGLAFGVTYTFMKAIDEGSDFTGTAANRDLSTNRAQSQFDSFGDRRGLSNFDSTHSTVLYYSYDLPRPARQGWLAAVGSNWQVSGSALMKTGTPLTLYVGSDAPGFGNVDGGPSDRPNIIDPSILGMTISHPNIAPTILRRDRFGFVVPGEHRGSLGRGTFRKASINNMNAAIAKRWRLPGNGERALQFRAEAFNLTNTPQFDEPNRNFNASVFGKITNTLNDGRILQFGLRLIL